MSVPKPQKRGILRRTLGKEFFILKRSIQDITQKICWANQREETLLPSLLYNHKSHILRPLQGVDPTLQHNKIVNLMLAGKKINRITIQPGETFSFWKLVGRPSKKKGYLDGLVLRNGTITKGIGGGLCQMGNLLYWLFLHSSLTITERWRHSYDVFPDVQRTLPFGSGATLAYNYIDLRIKNRTSQTYQIHIWIEDEHLHGELRSNMDEPYTFAIKETDHQFRKQLWGGYTRHNQIWQYRTNKETDICEKKLITENHAIMMYDPLLEYDNTTLSGDSCA